MQQKHKIVSGHAHNSLTHISLLVCHLVFCGLVVIAIVPLNEEVLSSNPTFSEKCLYKTKKSYICTGKSRPPPPPPPPSCKKKKKTKSQRIP